MDVVAGIFNKLVVATPFLLVTTLGVKAREQKPSYSYTSYSAVENKNISAYIPFVREAEKGFVGRDFAEPAVARKLAREWIRGTASGVLKPLPQIAVDDSSRDGVKAEILRDAELIAESLNYVGAKETNAHQYGKAIDDEMLALNLLSMPRMFDYASLSACVIPQRRALDIVKECLPQLPEAKRTLVKKALMQFTIKPQELMDLTMDARSVLLKFEDSPNAGHENWTRLESYISVANKPTMSELRKTRSIPIQANSDDGLIDLVNEYRLGYASALEMNGRFAQI